MIQPFRWFGWFGWFWLNDAVDDDRAVSKVLFGYTYSRPFIQLGLGLGLGIPTLDLSSLPIDAIFTRCCGCRLNKVSSIPNEAVFSTHPIPT